MESRVDIWRQAADMVAERLPDFDVHFDWPGTIDIVVAPRGTLLVFGTNADTIGADVDTWLPSERLPEGMWDYSDSPAALITDVSSDETRPDMIADAIVGAFWRWYDARHMLGGWLPSPVGLTHKPEVVDMQTAGFHATCSCGFGRFLDTYSAARAVLDAHMERNR